MSMEIHNLGIGARKINPPVEKKSQKITTENPGEIADSITISNSINSLQQDMYITTDFSPRIELINAIAQRIAQGSYDDSNNLENVAEKIIDSPPVKEAVTEIIAIKGGDSEDSTGKAERATSRAVQNYYDNPDMLRAIANRLMDVLGI